jgi:hypothetical protein
VVCDAGNHLLCVVCLDMTDRTVEPIDLATLPNHPDDTRRVFGLLLLTVRFEPRRGPMTYLDIRKRLGLKNQSNWPQHFARIRAALNEALPANWVIVCRKGKEAALQLNAPEGVAFRISSAAVSLPRLKHFCGIAKARSPVHARETDDHGQLALVSHMAGAELRFRRGEFEQGYQELDSASRQLRGTTSARLKTLVYLYRLRMLRRTERWDELLVLLKRARLAAKGKDWTSHERVVLEGLVTLFEGWHDYDGADAGNADAYVKIQERLEAEDVAKACLANNWIDAERHSLTALLKRRLAQATAQRISSSDTSVLWRESLDHNMEAIELAMLSCDIEALSNYVSNRGLLLMALRRQEQKTNQEITAEKWIQAGKWMGLGEELSRNEGRGSSNLWSPTFFLVLRRYSEDSLSWSDLMEQVVEVCPSLRVHVGMSAIDLALALAAPTLKSFVADYGKIAKPSYQRQLLLFGQEFAHEAQKIGYSYAKAPPIMQDLHRALARMKPALKRRGAGRVELARVEVFEAWASAQ